MVAWMSNDYEFRAMTSDDLPMLADWLQTPHVAYWYSDPDYIDELEEHRQDDRIDQKIVLFQGTPFAYLQDYDIDGWPDHHLGFLPSGSRGLDTFIGRAKMIGTGHGKAYLAQAAARLLGQNVPALGIDPHPENKRAIRAYEHVGFHGDKVLETEWGRVRIMQLKAS